MKEDLFRKRFNGMFFVKRSLALIVLMLFFFTFFAFSGPLVIAQEDSNVTTKEDALEALEKIETIRDKMSSKGFNVLRINDTLSTAEEIFLAQESREDKGRQPDYYRVIPYKEDVEKFYNQAVSARDELYSLELGVEKLKDKGINSSEAQVILDKIEKEIQDERYDKALELVPSAERKISDLESEHTAAKVFYEATTSSFFGFISDYYKQVLILILVFFVLYLLFRKKIWEKYYHRKIKNLEDEKKSINELVKKIQSGYFEKGSISESNYNIRSKKYAELVRDLDRRIPLYQEKINGLYDENVFMKPINMLKSEEKDEKKQKKKTKKESHKPRKKNEKRRKKRLEKLKKMNEKEKSKLERETKKDMKKKKKEIKRLKKKKDKNFEKSKKRYSGSKKKPSKKDKSKNNKRFKKSKK